MRLTVLVDHQAAVPDVATEWGTSVYVEANGERVLFDTGTTGLFADNAQELGLSVTEIDLAVLSHAHADHGGGLARFFELNGSAPVWVGAGATPEIFLRLGPLKKPVGLDAEVLASTRLRPIESDTEVAPGIHLLTDIPATFPEPRGNSILFRGEAGGLIPEDFRHEIVMVVAEPDGLVILTGCSHHGVLNMVEAVRTAFPGRNIKALVGGFHFMGLPVAGLLGEHKSEIRHVAEELRDSGIPRVITMHCTEQRGFDILREVLGDRVEYAGAGASIEL